MQRTKIQELFEIGEDICCVHCLGEYLPLTCQEKTARRTCVRAFKNGPVVQCFGLFYPGGINVTHSPSHILFPRPSYAAASPLPPPFLYPDHTRNLTSLFRNHSLRTCNDAPPDDIHVRLGRIGEASSEWSSEDFDYVGCLTKGFMAENAPGDGNHEHLGAIMPDRRYYSYMSGGFYVLSGRAATIIAEKVRRGGLGNLRPFFCEDCSVGLWMLAHNVRHGEDPRLCQPACIRAESIAVWHRTAACQGLCEPIKTIRSMHQDPNCISSEPLESLWSASGDRVINRQDVADLGCRSIVNGTLERSRCAFGPSHAGQ